MVQTQLTDMSIVYLTPEVQARFALLMWHSYVCSSQSPGLICRPCHATDNCHFAGSMLRSTAAAWKQLPKKYWALHSAQSYIR
jgi:hypothetical protein